MMMEFSLDRILRDNIKGLQAYSCARDEYSGTDAVFLDANENPYDTGFNRYPDPYQRELKAVIAELKGVTTENMVLGNGSDELIDLLIRSVCVPGRDHILVFSPGYSMYEVCAAINDVGVRKIDLTREFLPDWLRMREQMDEHTRIIFLCTPNNPTGKVIPIAQIEALCESFNGLVLVDEAYIDFAEEISATRLVEKYRNVVVLQTLSKSWGMAGLRIGMCFADRELVAVLNRVKAPYNISSLSQQAALDILSDREEFCRKMLLIKEERGRLVVALQASGLFERVYPSAGNFVLVISARFRELYDFMVQNKVVVRLRNIPPLIAGGIRITVGTKTENDRLLELLEEFQRA